MTWLLVGAGGVAFVAGVVIFAAVDLQRKLDELGEPYPWL